MRKICKRTLALLLAVVLCVSAMPFSAFALEIEDELQGADVPMPLARDPISSVKA